MTKNPRARRRSTGGQHMRYIGDAAVMLEHYGEGQYEAAIALVRGPRRGDIVWEEPISARPTGDPDSADVIDRIAASAVALAAFESENDLVRDATAWAMDGKGGYEVQRGNPEGPPPGVPWGKGKTRNPAGACPDCGCARHECECLGRLPAMPTIDLVVEKAKHAWVGWLIGEGEGRLPVGSVDLKHTREQAEGILLWQAQERYASSGGRGQVRLHKNPAGLTAKGERMYEDIKRSYEERGDPRAKEIAARTVLARASEGTPGLKKNPSHAEILRAARGGPRSPAVEAWIHQYPKTWENMRRRSR